MEIKKDSPSISFTGVITILGTIITIVWFDTEPSYMFYWTKVIILVGIYFILALSAADFCIIGEIVSQIIILYKDDTYGDAEKVLLIKDQLEIYNSYFTKVFAEVESFKKKKRTKIGAEISSRFYRIIKGKVTLIESIWILVYLIYVIIIQGNFIQIPLPFNIVVTIIFLFGLQLTSGNVTGLGKILRDLYQIVRRKNIIERDSETLADIIHTIRLLCLAHNRIAIKIQQNTGKTISEFLAQS